MRLLYLLNSYRTAHRNVSSIIHTKSNNRKLISFNYIVLTFYDAIDSASSGTFPSTIVKILDTQFFSLQNC